MYIRETLMVVGEVTSELRLVNVHVIRLYSVEGFLLLKWWAYLQMTSLYLCLVVVFARGVGQQCSLRRFEGGLCVSCCR